MLQEPHGSEVEVREHGFAAVRGDRLPQAAGDDVERLIPARTPEAAVGLRPVPDQRLEQPILGVDAIEVVGHLSAEEAGRDRMLRIAGHVGRPALVVHRHQHRATVRTIMRTHSANNMLRHAERSLRPVAGDVDTGRVPSWLAFSARC
jgi:hypothetical protein